MPLDRQRPGPPGLDRVERVAVRPQESPPLLCSAATCRYRRPQLLGGYMLRAHSSTANGLRHATATHPPRFVAWSRLMMPQEISRGWARRTHYAGHLVLVGPPRLEP